MCTKKCEFKVRKSSKFSSENPPTIMSLPAVHIGLILLDADVLLDGVGGLPGDEGGLGRHPRLRVRHYNGCRVRFGNSLI